ncbi:hypothetical protein LCGC14_0514660 [marine sediment metagenome]|uniref:Uncharacterized protein n=1 Tax=marine sediment metagenome TaxID=412755 RepID=A0A0F9SIP9_9ZZZZ
METTATIRRTDKGVEILKFCYFCGATNWCEVTGSHIYKCTVCHKPPNNGHFYKSKHSSGYCKE